MALPQTAAGVGAIGIDPEPEEMDKIKTFDDILNWLGAAGALKDGMLAALGGGQPKLRDICLYNGEVLG